MLVLSHGQNQKCKLVRNSLAQQVICQSICANDAPEGMKEEGVEGKKDGEEEGGERRTEGGGRRRSGVLRVVESICLRFMKRTSSCNDFRFKVCAQKTF